MHHPDNNEPLLIAGSKFMILIVPLYDLYLSGVSLKILIHRQVAASLALAGVQLQHLQKALVSATSDITFLLVPTDHVQVCAVWHPDLQ
jgi:hypothetical protein